MAVDWLKIKNEYISGGISYRKLAEKYGVSFPTLRDRATKEKWKDQRDVQRNKVVTKTEQKTEEKISDALSEEAAAKVKIRAGLVKLAAEWVEKQDAIEDTNDFRRMVQSCCELGIMDVQENGDLADDGLLAALSRNAEELFADGDDSAMLPEEGEN
ncbi:MAG: hypothetical protein IKC03_01615 [Oscillospiraceae bacterium]|nr:hypothetical protein [Oscillospiraceae bacterium]